MFLPHMSWYQRKRCPLVHHRFSLRGTEEWLENVNHNCIVLYWLMLAMYRACARCIHIRSAIRPSGDMRSPTRFPPFLHIVQCCIDYSIKRQVEVSQYCLETLLRVSNQHGVQHFRKTFSANCHSLKSILLKKESNIHWINPSINPVWVLYS